MGKENEENEIMKYAIQRSSAPTKGKNPLWGHYNKDSHAYFQWWGSADPILFNSIEEADKFIRAHTNLNWLKKENLIEIVNLSIDIIHELNLGENLFHV